MKSFNNFLKENGAVGTSDENMTIDFNVNAAAIENPAVVRRLNAYVGAIANMEHMLPEHALSKMRNGLSRIGFSFGQIPEMTEQKGSFDLPLSIFGGRFGKDTDTPHDEFVNDDGISNKIEGGLALKIQYEMLSNNSCKVFAKVE